MTTKAEPVLIPIIADTVRGALTPSTRAVPGIGTAPLTNTAPMNDNGNGTSKSARRERWLSGSEMFILIVIVLVVGLMAGAASFTHVHDWTMVNSPASTGDWFGWANAVISELIPTASLIVIARRRRRDPAAPIGYPMFLLLAAVGVSITAQVAVAVKTPFGILVSVIPALAFLALSKLVFSRTKARPHPQALAPTPALTAPAPSTFDEVPAPAPSRPAARKPAAKKPATTPRAASSKPRKNTAKNATTEPTPTSTTEPTPSPATAPVPAPVSAPVPVPVPAVLPATVPASTAVSGDVAPVRLAVRDLLPGARLYAESYQQTHGEPITANKLAARLRVSTAIAKAILDELDKLTAPTQLHQAHNGTPTATAVGVAK